MSVLVFHTDTIADEPQCFSHSPFSFTGTGAVFPS